MSQSIVQVAHQQVKDAVQEALKTMSEFFWLRSQSYANPHLVRLV